MTRPRPRTPAELARVPEGLTAMLTALKGFRHAEPFEPGAGMGGVMGIATFH